MGLNNSKSEENERRFWKRKSQELWLDSRTYKQIYRCLKFITNLNSYDFSMRYIKPNSYMFLYSLMQIKPVKSLSLQSLDISIDSYKELRRAIKGQEELTGLRLSFEPKQKDELKYSLNSLGETIALKNSLLHFTLTNWGKGGQLEINGKVLNRILKASKLKSLTIQKLEISNFSSFTEALSTNSTIYSLSLQSSTEYSKEELNHIYSSLSNNIRLSKLEVQDKRHYSQYDWKEFAKLLCINNGLKELTINGGSVAAQGAGIELCNGLENNTGLKSITFSGFDNSLLSKNTIMLKAITWHERLETLNLSGNKIDTKEVIVGLCRILQVCPNIKKLIIRHVFRECNEGISLKLINELKKNKKILTIDLSANIFTEREQDALVGLASCDNSIQSLSIAHCNLSDKTLANLFKALSTNTKIQLLDLRTQHLEDNKYASYSLASKELANFMTTNNTLKLAHIEGNIFEDESLKSFFEAVTKSQCMIKLHVTYGGKDKGVIKAIGNLIRDNTRINKFCLEETQLVDNSPIVKQMSHNKAIVSLELQATRFTEGSIEILGNSFKTLNSLTILKLIGSFENGKAAHFSDGLARNSTIKYIALTNSNITHAESKEFIQFLRNNSTLEYLQMYYKVLELNDDDVPLMVEILTLNRVLKTWSMVCGTITSKGLAKLTALQRKHFWLKLEIF